MTGPLQSAGTRIACIPVHRTGKEASMVSPRRPAAIVECSPQKHVAGRSQWRSEYAAVDSSLQSHQCQHVAASEQVPEKTEESREAIVNVKTPEKCKLKKTSSPLHPTDLCSVSLSRIVIPDRKDLTEPAKKETELSACNDVCQVASNVNTNLSLHSICDRQNEVESASLLSTSIVYPSCEQNIFLGSFGLASKAALPQRQNATNNQLHRDIGGKLRRSIKLNAATQLLYRRTNSMRSLSFEGNGDVLGVEIASRSLHSSPEGSPRASHTSKFSPVSVKKLSFPLRKRPKLLVRDKSSSSDCSSSTVCCEVEPASSVGEEQRSSLNLLADTALAHLKAVTVQITPVQDMMKSSAAKSKVRFDVRMLLCQGLS